MQLTAKGLSLPKDASEQYTQLYATLNKQHLAQEEVADKNLHVLQSLRHIAYLRAQQKKAASAGKENQPAQDSQKLSLEQVQVVVVADSQNVARPK